MTGRAAVSGVVGVVGVVLAALAVGIVLAPGVVLSVGPVDRAVGFLSTRDPRSVLLVVGALAALVALTVSRGASHYPTLETDGTDRPAEHPPESVAAEWPTAPGSTLDAGLGQVDDASRSAVRETLRATAVRRLVRFGSDPETARNAVEMGAWTDDDLAAALLGDPDPPLSARVRAWLDPEAEHRRRVERTVAAVEALGETR